MANGSLTSREAILQQYEIANKLMQEQYAQYAHERVGAKTFASELEQKIAQREISPEARKREKEVISQLFAAPEEMRARLEGTQLLPSEIGGLVSGRMNTYLDQLDSIRKSRRDRQESISNLIKSAAVGVEAQAELAELQYTAAKDQRDTLWDKYREAQRQYEWQVTQARLAAQENESQKKLRVVRKINNYFANLKYTPWDPTAGGWPRGDIGYRAEDYIKARDMWYDEYGAYEGFEKSFPINDFTNVKSEKTISKLEKAGVDIYAPLRDEEDDVILSDLQKNALDVYNGIMSHDAFISGITDLERSGVLWDLSKKELIKSVLSIAGLILTEDEFNQYLGKIQENIGSLEIPATLQLPNQ